MRTANAVGTSKLGGGVVFAFESYDAMNKPDLSWTLGTGTSAGGTTAAGTATITGAVPPGLVRPGMQSVDVVAMYTGDATHLPSTSAKVPLAFGPISFAIQPLTPTSSPGGMLTFTSTGGVAPIKWYTGAETTCNTATSPTCSNIVETTGVFTAGPSNGTIQVRALDADGAEASVVVTVACVPKTACAAGAPCGTTPDGCGGMVMCGTCAGGQTCVGNQCATSSSSNSSGTGTGGGASSSSSGSAPFAKGACSCEAAGDPARSPGVFSAREK